jgi:hypothetical protein
MLALEVRIIKMKAPLKRYSRSKDGKSDFCEW